MRLLRRAHDFEYRDAAGIDRLGQADVWENHSGERAVLVLRGLPGAALESGEGGGESRTLLAQARQAVGYLAHTWLPFLVPYAQLDVLILHAGPQATSFTLDGSAPDGGGDKLRALLLP